MAVTTAAAIRDAIATAIEAMVPTIEPARRFARLRHAANIEDLTSPNSGDDRRFTLRFGGGGPRESPTDNVEARVRRLVELRIMYVYGDPAEADDLDARIESDAAELERLLVPLTLAGTLPAAANLVEWTADAPPAWALGAAIKTITLTIDFWRAA